MTQKRKRRSAIVEIGKGPTKVRIYTINRKDGYDQFTLAWKEGGRRRTRCFSCKDEAKMVGQQVTVRLINGFSDTCEATRRDLDILRHCERTATEFGVTLAAAIEEWASARRTAGSVPLSDAVRFYAANRADLFPTRSNVQTAAEFSVSLKRKG
jgi:hypothetical protein